MNILKRIIKWFFVIGLSGYVLICGLLYFFQEKMIFVPKKLPATFDFRFSNPYEEIFINTTDGVKLNGLLFKSDN